MHRHLNIRFVYYAVLIEALLYIVGLILLYVVLHELVYFMCNILKLLIVLRPMWNIHIGCGRNAQIYNVKAGGVWI